MCRKIIIISAISLVAIFIVTLSCNITVEIKASGKTFERVMDIKHNKFALFLGISPITRNGKHNYYFSKRIKATEELYKADKIDIIIASGEDYTKIENSGAMNQQQ